MYPRKASRRWCASWCGRKWSGSQVRRPVSDFGASARRQVEAEKTPAEVVVEDLNEEGPPIDERTMQDIADAMAAFQNM